ncbi:MAG: hypothetical protein AB8H79_04610, partial [Myxococcota bacterium]
MDARARVLLRDLRSDMPTHQLSERLGYANDIVAEWESGRKWPTASELFRVCSVRGINIYQAARTFDKPTAPLLGPANDKAVAEWLTGVCGGVDPSVLSEKTGRSKTVVRRWMRGQVRPQLPEFLRLIDAATGRGEAFIAALTPPKRAPASPAVTASASAAARSRAHRQAAHEALGEAWAARNAARAGPMDELPADEETVEVFVASSARASVSPDDPSDEVWRAVASQDYAALEVHRAAWLEARTGHSRDVVLDTLHALEAAGLVRRGQDRWHALRPAPLEPPNPNAHALTPIQRLAQARSAQIVLPLGSGDLNRCRALERRSQAEL